MLARAEYPTIKQTCLPAVTFVIFDILSGIIGLAISSLLKVLTSHT